MRILILLSALLVSACGAKANPVAPQPPVTLSLPGTWTGTYSSAQLGAGTARFVLTHQGSAVGGTWSITATRTGETSSGTVSGTASNLTSGATFTLTLASSDPRTCPFQSTMTALAHLNELLGDWVTTNCTVAASGTLILRR